MLKYLICQISLKLHKNKLSNFKIFLAFGDLQEDEKYQQLVKIRITLKNENQEQLNLDDCVIFKNILNNLADNIQYQYNFNNQTHDIDIKQIFDKHIFKKNINDSEEQIFDETVTIKDSKLEDLRNADTSEKQESKFSHNYKESTVIFDSIKIDSKDGQLFLNLDDELNILHMHNHVFKKEKIILNCCSHDNELQGIIAQIGTRQILNNTETPKIVVLLDHVLDCITGLEVLVKAKKLQQRFSLNIIWVLVSSTEDKQTLNGYEKEGIIQFISKPLNKGKLKSLLEWLKNDKTQNEHKDENEKKDETKDETKNKNKDETKNANARYQTFTMDQLLED